jgi:RNA polymerase sigma-70 factor (ECF subfamily)
VYPETPKPEASNRIAGDSDNFAMPQVTLRRELRILPGSNMGPRETAVFEELYRCYAEDVFRFSLYLSGNWALAQDLTSEVFVRAWSATAPVQVATAKAYLFTIARNLFLDSRRREAPQAEIPASLRASPALSPEVREELRQTLDDLGQIAEGDRSALVMSVFEEMSHEEIARALGVSVGAVKSRIFRARLRLSELRQQRLVRSKK